MCSKQGYSYNWTIIRVPSKESIDRLILDDNLGTTAKHAVPVLVG